MNNSRSWKIESVVGQSKSALNDDAIKVLSPETINRFDDFILKNKFKKTLMVNLCKDMPKCPQTELKFEVANFNNFYISLNTKDLNFFKDSTHKLDPMQVRVNLSIYYCTNGQVCSASGNNISTASSLTSTGICKQLLNVVAVKFILGHAKILKKAATLNCIEFEVYKHKQENKSSLKDTFVGSKLKKSVDYHDDSGRTVAATFHGEKNLQPESDVSEFKLEQLFPLSNGGNVDIQIACYFTYENKEDDIMRGQLDELIFKEGYKLKLKQSVFYLESNIQTKSCARLFLNTIEKPSSNENAENLLCVENSKIQMIIEIKPNGHKAVVPINILLKENKAVPESTTSTSTNSFREEETTLSIRKYVHM